MDILTKDGLKLFNFIKEHFKNLTAEDAHEIMLMKNHVLLNNMFDTSQPVKILQYNYLKHIHESNLDIVDKCILKTIVYYSYQNREFPGYANFTFLETEKEDPIDNLTYGNCWIYAYIAVKMFNYKVVTCSYYQIYYPILYIKLLSEHPEAKNMTFRQFFNNLNPVKTEETEIKPTQLKEWINKHIKPGEILFIRGITEECGHTWPMLNCGLFVEINQSCLMNSTLIAEKPPLLRAEKLFVSKITFE